MPNLEVHNIGAKGLVTELTPPHAQSAWGFRGKKVRTVRLTAYCNYLSKKKKRVHNISIQN